VTGIGDTAGWHLFAASVGDGWAWHPLATLRPGGDDNEGWVGQQCSTGDGAWVVAVVAPWHSIHSTEGMGMGGTAYAVDAHSGQVRPLASGVSLAYFNPGCGTGSRVALTTYPARNQAVTRVTVVDAASAAALESVTVKGEFTSAVPVGAAVVAAAHQQVVVLSNQGARALAKVDGEAFDLRPNTTGGVDLLSATAARTSVWTWAEGSVQQTGSGDAQQVRLLAGRAGHNVLAGAGPPASTRFRTVSGPFTPAPSSASLEGSVLLLDAPRAQVNSPAGREDRRRTLVNTVSGAVIARVLPDPLRQATTTVPGTNLGFPALSPTRSAKSTTSLAATTAANTSTPTCAVPRNDLWNQVPQPNSAQIDWAIQQAARGWLLPGNIPTRPNQSQNYKIGDSQALPAYYPSQDLPPGTISGYAGAPVPPQVLYGVLADESNWNQASWHALAGYGANPLIANYYGSTNPANPTDINYDNADCGYGLGQITDIMKVGAPGVSQATQVAVAVDYAENVAAAARALVTKWNQLASLGDPMNNGDPGKIENWYGAIWAYNSGVHMGDPGYGLGWFNNPANPIYNPGRAHFLRTTYTDANHPQDWPYQERVFGWMETPQTDPNGGNRFAGLTQNLNIPPVLTFCSTTVNSCNPSAVWPNDPCPSENSSCWWNRAAQWVDCSSPSTCSAPVFTIASSTAPEPAWTARNQNCATAFGLPGGTIPSNGIIVDDTSLSGQNPQSLDPNVIGCPTTPTAWASHGAMQLLNSSGAPLGPSDVAAIDLHQIGTGFGGHSWFTHTRSDTAMETIARWTPTLATAGLYDIRAFVPDPGATATVTAYQIFGHSGSRPYQQSINQNNYSNQWVSLGKFPMQPGGYVQLGSTIAPGDGSDLAFAAMIFIPATADDTNWIDAANAYPFKGWGTNLAWWANALGGWPSSNRTTLEQQLFSAPSPGAAQLGLNVVRYNIGASPSGAYPSGCQPSPLRDAAQIPSPQQSSGGAINLAQDQNQVSILTEADQMIRAAGQAPHYEAFANSPPWWMTISGCPTGYQTGVIHDNLASQNYQAYADYLAQVVQHFRTDKGITFDTVEPFNEPASQFAWPGVNPSPPQEGANFQASTQDSVIALLCSGVDKSTLGSTQISVPDENSIDYTTGTYQSSQYQHDACISQINSHGYTNGTAPYTGTGRGQLSSVAKAGGKRLWLSEFTVAPTSPDISMATTLSKQIAKDVQYLRPEAWIYWQAVEESGQWGLLNTTASFNPQPNPSSVVTTARYWALAQYSQFIRPGYTILTAHDPSIDDSQEHNFVLTVAAQDPVSRKIVIITTNDGSDRSLSYDLSRFSLGSGPTVQVYQTSNRGYDIQGPDPLLSGTTLSDFQPGQSITTYVVTPGAGARALGPAPLQRAQNTSPQAVAIPHHQAAWSPVASSLRLDGRLLPLTVSCIRNAKQDCLDPSGLSPELSLTCNVSGPVAGDMIDIRLSGGQEIEIGATDVMWYIGREQAIQAVGGTRSFNAIRGAVVDATLGVHHLIGTVVCR